MKITPSEAAEYAYKKVNDFAIIAIMSGVGQIDSEEIVISVIHTIINKKREFNGYSPLNAYIAVGVKRQTAKFFKDKYVGEFTDKDRHEQMNLARSILNGNREKYS